MSDRRLVVASIAAKNYVPRVRVLAASLHQYHPELALQVLLSDRLDGEIVPGNEPYSLVQLSDLGLVDEQQFCFRHDLRGRASALKPLYLEYLLNHGYSAVLFLDPDTLVTAPLDPLLDPLQSGSIVLTPHLLHPPGDAQGVQRELEILRAGVFNAGVVGVSESAEASTFLAWWKQRLDRHSQDSVAEGMYYDQRWLDFVPGLFPSVHIVRDAGCNVAHWNLNERPLDLEGGGIRIDGRLCRLMHFSGHRHAVPDRLTTHADWVSSTGTVEIRVLTATYRRLLSQAGEAAAATWRPAWEHLDNGLSVPPVVRAIYAASDPGEWAADPFRCGEHSFFDWLVRDADGQEPVITNLWHRLWNIRAEFQARWPEPLGHSRAAFAAWIEAEGRSQYDVQDYQR